MSFIPRSLAVGLRSSLNTPMSKQLRPQDLQPKKPHSSITCTLRGADVPPGSSLPSTHRHPPRAEAYQGVAWQRFESIPSSMFFTLLNLCKERPPRWGKHTGDPRPVQGRGTGGLRQEGEGLEECAESVAQRKTTRRRSAQPHLNVWQVPGKGVVTKRGGSWHVGAELARRAISEALWQPAKASPVVGRMCVYPSK